MFIYIYTLYIYIYISKQNSDKLHFLPELFIFPKTEHIEMNKTETLVDLIHFILIDIRYMG